MLRASLMFSISSSSIGDPIHAAFVQPPFQVGLKRCRCSYAVSSGKRHRLFGLLASVFILALLPTTGTVVFAQAETTDKVAIDFRATQAPGKLSFLSDGVAWSKSLQVNLRGNLTPLNVRIPAAGEVRFVESTKSQVQVQIKKLSRFEVAVEFRPAKPILSRRQLENQGEQLARKLLAEFHSQARKEMSAKPPGALRNYIQSQNTIPPAMDDRLLEVAVDARALELASPRILVRLQELTSEHPTWIAPEERARYSQLSSKERFTALAKLHTLELAVKYLEDWGLDVDISRLNGAVRIMSKVDGMDAVLGIVSGTAKGNVRALDRREIDMLRDRMRVEGDIYFYPATNPHDANSQWFHAQRVVTAIRGIDCVRIEGTCDASAGDTSDWWDLVNFDPITMKLQFSGHSSVSHELYHDRVQGTKLRVTSSAAEPVSYAFDIVSQANGSSGSTSTSSPTTTSPVIVHESPAKSDAKFPF